MVNGRLYGDLGRSRSLLFGWLGRHIEDLEGIGRCRIGDGEGKGEIIDQCGCDPLILVKLCQGLASLPNSSGEGTLAWCGHADLSSHWSCQSIGPLDPPDVQRSLIPSRERKIPKK